MRFADAHLARRIEAAEAANARGCSTGEGGSPAEVLEVAGGCAIFAGAGSPLTQAVGIGLDGPVSDPDLAAMETFFHARGAKTFIDVCPLSNPALIDILARRGYVPTQFNNVLARAMAGAQITPTPRTRRATPPERDLWSYTVGQGFFEQHELTTSELDVGRAIFSMQGALCYLAVTANGQCVGGAALAVRSGIAALFADSVAPGFRRAGFHLELIAARLHEALARGCDMATASTLPGSGSQRNYERQGFEVVYTRVTMVRASFFF